MNYDNRIRRVVETVQIGDQLVEVEASLYWGEPDDLPNVHLAIGNNASNGRTIRLTNLGAYGVQQLAEVLLTVERMLQAESVDAKAVIDD